MQQLPQSRCSPLQRQRLLTPLTQAAQRSRRPLSCSGVAPCALFGRKKAAEEPPPPPAKKGLGALFGGKGTNTAAKEAPKQAKGLFQKAEKAVTKVAQKPKQTFLEAIDFKEPASYRDAKLLSDAKYGKGGRMSKEQAEALRRKVGGTAKNYFKEWVDVRGDYTDKGYVSKEPSSLSEGVPGLPFLVGIVLALFGALGYVVSQT